ncbi:MAG: toll/interleukin-1 receptor domain-containing protein [Anaerolineales bacterium]|nr:toll/interleukin-1 receptor domain-containing protein [Anaerolineales bacterium]NUQ84614.1 toll/interleukin-1 receptor domain-containing protein [Anaerolineales bacterium]
MPNNSGFKWACFVSYRHGQGDLLKNFINELTKALENRLGLLGMGLKVFVDRERLNPSYSVTPGLAEAICQSVCMIVVYNNGYFDKNNPFCAKEFCAMVELEKKRLRNYLKR